MPFKGRYCGVSVRNPQAGCERTIFGPFEDGWTKEDVVAVIERGDPKELLYVPIVISMDPPNCAWAEAICLRLSSHDNAYVRGNSVLGFGHLARTCGKLNKDTVYPIIVAALSDPDAYVRGQAHTAVDETSHFLGWCFSDAGVDCCCPFCETSDE